MKKIPSLLLQSILGARLATTRGRLWLPGLQAPLTIRRDAFAIPYIDAETDDDAWFGLGFCQAQDRAFQLELRLRTVRGTLSALFGPTTLPLDRLSRRVGFHESAVRQLAVLDADVRAQIKAFVRGLNAGLEAGATRVAPEFALIRSRPTPWEPADVVGVAKMMSFLLIGNWDVELARLKILTLDGEQALRDLDPTYPADHPVTYPPGQPAGPAIDRLSDDLAAFKAFASGGTSPSVAPEESSTSGQGGASNAWVIAGSRTASGRPILANDPHLEPTLPPHWYLARLTTPEWSVAGAALVGALAIGAGHNGFCAWGITAGLADTVDLFLEDVGPDGRSVRRGSTFVPCELRSEVIEVKGAPDVTEEVLVTPSGPLIGPSLMGDVPSIAMRAVWLDARPARGFLRAPYARSLEDFRREFEAWPLLGQNVVYADTTGAIAWQLVGEVPRRRKGWGLLPLPAADPEAGWHEDGVPFNQMPHAIDPEAGFIATANAKPIADDARAPYLGADWLDGYRQTRITELLEDRRDWDVPSSIRLQMDEMTLAWREVRDAVLAVPPLSPDAVLALDFLGDWDGRLAVESIAASVFELFTTEVWRRMADARAPRSRQYALGLGLAPLLPVSTFAAGRWSSVYRRIREQPQGWFGRGWQAEMSEALDAAIHKLRSDFGREQSGWRWGRIRRLTLAHPMAVIPPLAFAFSRGPFPWGGDGNTISQAGAAPLKMPSSPGVIASLRMTVDVGNWDASRFVLPGGQSGNPFSPHYDDQLPLWLRGEGVPIAWTPAALAATSRETLYLTPLPDVDAAV